MIELKEAIFWKLVNNKDMVVNTPRIVNDKMSNYIGTGTTNRIHYSYPDVKDREYPMMIISTNENPDASWPETSNVLVEIYLYTVASVALGKHHSQLEAFFKMVKYFLAEQWDEFNDLEEVKDGEGNLVIGGKFHVESFKFDWGGSVVHLNSSNEFQLPSRWFSYVTETQEA